MTAVTTDRDRNGPRDLISVAADGLAVAGGSLVSLSLAELVESPWNPRKHFDPARLAEMVESLKKGQLAPIIVRPYRRNPAALAKALTSGAAELYEIGAGHRRFRAAPAAGLGSLLAIVREMNDVAFLELLTIENKQRDDVAPLDEANGFKLLMEKAGYDVGKLAARIGLSTKYVYDRLKLLQLIPAAKKLLEDGVITAGHAILLARLTPTDQKRAIGDVEGVVDAGYYAAHRESLLLRPDEAAEGEELALYDRVKPVSVREFQQAIQKEIRATPDRLDPFLFPESTAALEAAKEEKLSVIHITREYRVDDAARDEKIKTYGSEAWKRADGAVDEEDWRGRKTKSKPCAFSRYGFVASGPGQGEVFKVCINKQKCATHWPDQVKALKEREKRAKSGKTGAAAKPKRDSYQEQADRYRREEAKRDAERARWKTARPAILKAVAAKIAAAPAGPTGLLANAVLDRCAGDHKPNSTVPRGRTLEDLIRHAAFQLYVEDVDDLAPGYYRHNDAVKCVKALGIDAEKIVDEVAPKPKAEKKPATKKPKKGARR